jgi:ferredoxin
MVAVDAIATAANTERPGEDPKDHVAFIVDEDVCTRCALCVDSCPTGVIILGTLAAQPPDGDPHTRTNRHGYAYGVRF